MKKILAHAALLVLFIHPIIFSQSGWFWQNPLPQGNTLNCISILPSKKIVLGGDYGTILISTNLGENWKYIKSCGLINSSCYEDFEALYFVNENTGYAATEGGKIICTTNGGNNWNLIYSNPKDDFNAMDFANEETGFIGGRNLYKTTNGGLDWILVKKNAYCYRLSFVNSNTGWYIDGYRILKTTDSGINWTEQRTFRYEDFIMGLFFINENTGWVVGSGWTPLFKTINGGLKWKAYSTCRGNDICFIDELNGFICSDNALYKSSNGGINWNRVNVSDSNGYYFSSIKLQNGIGVVVGASGLIYISEGYDAEWKSKYKYQRFNITAAQFVDSMNGYTSGYGRIMKSNDGGVSWTISFNEALGDFDYNSIYFTNKQTGWVTGRNGICPGYGRIMHTTNSGESWNQQFNITAKYLYCVKFADDSTGFCTGSGIILKTTNSGNTWIPHTPPVDVTYEDLFIINKDTIFSSGGFGTIIFSTDGGNLWLQSRTHTNYGIKKIIFSNTLTGWAISYRRLLKTSDVGLNWQVTNLTYDPIDIRLFSDSTVYIFNTSGINMTCDGGNSWHYSQIQECLVSNVYFINQNTGWILGDYGSILKTTNARRPVGKIVLPEKYSLHQNYPNPFNPVTKIRFEIPPLNLPLSGGERERVMIKIYNILGREIATLINEQLQPGVFEVTWDGTNYPSGVYFYRLTTKDFSQTRKMVLLK